ncbi:MAG: UDP-3-O-(3-hydroxymyristoyl)glucosamine N-acyltransferase [Candidatus Omnitrophica bacterium]|nr:UDP-3-O-(3-hydroxymyristoyl)glucosamine N-acyltransferase [Candidatus Omnitrophota bacterium]MDE2222676.1 UDP-3-O-(3-hydroxymyristoyl)glucosamine N-acyltransferase [Candidatus Omnitrophota bacterium]
MTVTKNNLTVKEISASEIAALVKGELAGNGGSLVSGFSGIKEAKKDELTFLANPKYESLLSETQAGVILVPRQTVCPGKTVIRVDNPSLCFTEMVKHFLKDAPDYRPQGIHPTAVIGAKARLAADAAVGPHAIIENGAVIGKGSVIHAQCYVGHDAHLGEHCLLYPQVVVREKVFLGDRVIVHSGTVIGSDGYGYVPVDGRHMKIPQIGTVHIENDVEIGANVTIDRARFDKTIIGEGTKIDNLVQIAHNVVIGKHCLVIAQSGIAGSTRLGNHVILAAQSGLVGHIEIGDGAVVAAQSGVTHSINPGDQVFGSPAHPIKDAYRTQAHVQRLDKYVDMIKDLKKRVEKLEK